MEADFEDLDNRLAKMREQEQQGQKVSNKVQKLEALWRERIEEIRQQEALTEKITLQIIKELEPLD